MEQKLYYAKNRNTTIKYLWKNLNMIFLVMWTVDTRNSDAGFTDHPIVWIESYDMYKNLIALNVQIFKASIRSIYRSHMEFYYLSITFY